MPRSGSMMMALAVLVPVAALAGHAASGSAAPVKAAAATQPPAFAQCRACHSVDSGGKSGVGPNLFGVVGKVAGSKPGYAYSPAMRASGKRWDRANLDAYLKDPRAFVPGTKMVVRGPADAKKRQEIVDYLVTLK